MRPVRVVSALRRGRRAGGTRTPLRAVAAGMLAFAAACSSARPGSVASNPDVIDRAEIDRHVAGGTTNLHELIQRARPRWYESRGPRSFALETVILVYQNEQMLGGLEVLAQLRPDNVLRIRRLDGARAALLPGARGHVEAAIVVETSR